MSRVIVGVDPHKKSVTIEAVDEDGQVLATGRFPAEGHRAMLKYVREQWSHHVWAVEGAQGVVRPLAQRLLPQGETVLDVPAKLAARRGCSTPATPARPTRPMRSWSRCG